MLYCESVSNPLLEVADIEGLSKIAKKHNLKLVVDNTFSPLSISPAKLGADVMTGPLSAIEGLLKHPLTDIGLAKFLADFKKGN